MKTLQALHTSVFHSLEEQIAVIDQAGNILEINRAWQNFGADNGLPADYVCIGHNYLETLSNAAASGDSFADEALQGILDVIADNLAIFYFEYPCHSTNEKRWFTMRVTTLHGDKSKKLFVISHHNITQRKLAEERIEELAMQDPLTELGNRRAFHLFLNREMRSSIRNQSPIGLILLDVDYFKNYNDEFGHAAGDRCLIDIGKILSIHARRPGDLAARIGGDEFALILGNTKLEVVQEIAESILSAINDLKMFFSGSKQVTASVGLVSLVPQDQQSEEFLVQTADKALYRAKSAGRNQIATVPPKQSGRCHEISPAISAPPDKPFSASGG